jgi:hypothetical protein
MVNVFLHAHVVASAGASLDLDRVLRVIPAWASRVRQALSWMKLTFINFHFQLPCL